MVSNNYVVCRIEVGAPWDQTHVGSVSGSDRAAQPTLGGGGGMGANEATGRSSASCSKTTALASPLMLCMRRYGLVWV